VSGDEARFEDGGTEAGEPEGGAEESREAVEPERAVPAGEAGRAAGESPLPPLQAPAAAPLEDGAEGQPGEESFEDGADEEASEGSRSALRCACSPEEGLASHEEALFEDGRSTMLLQVAHIAREVAEEAAAGEGAEAASRLEDGTPAETPGEPEALDEPAEAASLAVEISTAGALPEALAGAQEARDEPDRARSGEAPDAPAPAVPEEEGEGGEDEGEEEDGGEGPVPREPDEESEAHFLRVMEFSGVKAALARHCACILGEQVVERMRLLHEAKPILVCLEQTDEMIRYLEKGKRLPLRGIHDVAGMVREAYGASRPLEPGDIANVASTLTTAHAVRGTLLAEVDFPRLTALVAHIEPFEALLERLRATIDERGKVRDDASARLWNIRMEARQLREQIERTLAQIASRSHVRRLLGTRAPPCAVGASSSPSARRSGAASRGSSKIAATRGRRSSSSPRRRSPPATNCRICSSKSAPRSRASSGR
jgi:hypothetical protein